MAHKPCVDCGVLVSGQRKKGVVFCRKCKRNNRPILKDKARPISYYK